MSYSSATSAFHFEETLRCTVKSIALCAMIFLDWAPAQGWGDEDRGRHSLW